MRSGCAGAFCVLCTIVKTSAVAALYDDDDDGSSSCDFVPCAYVVPHPQRFLLISVGTTWLVNITIMITVRRNAQRCTICSISVRLSARPSQAGIVLNRMNIRCCRLH